MPDVESNLVLPFAVIEREGAPAQEFPVEMTLATVLADVEKAREKAGLLKAREETLEFTSLLYWPIVVAPWQEGRHLVFDGMGIWSYVFSMGKVPDARGFAASLDSAADYRALLGLLQSRATLFDAFPDIERVPVMGLFIHEELMKDILGHAALAKTRTIRSTSLLTARILSPQVGEATRKMRGLLDQMKTNQDSLAVAGSALERALERTRREIAALREKTIASYGAKIDGVRPDVTSRVASLERERDEKWAAMQPRLLDLQAQVQKAEADYAHWDMAAKTQYGPEAQAAGQRAYAARGELDRSREAVTRYQQETAQTRESYDRQIQAQWERIRELERARDAEVQRLSQEEQGVASLVARLGGALNGLARQLDEAGKFLAGQGVPAAVTDVTLIRMPIVVASLVGDRGRRLVVYPPMVARAGKGVIGGIRSTFGGAVLPLEPKTEQFEREFRAGIERAIASDPSLAAYLTSVGNSNNMLHMANLREMLARGLAGLKSQGWIKDRHERDLILAVERHIQVAAQTAPRAAP